MGRFGFPGGANPITPGGGGSGIIHRQTGGIVPGPRNQPRLIMAHGGEMVTNPSLGQGGGGGITVIVNTGVGDPQAIAEEIVEVLQVYNQTNGPVPVEVAT